MPGSTLLHHTGNSGRVESEADVKADTIDHLSNEEGNPLDQQRARTLSDHNTLVLRFRGGHEGIHMLRDPDISHGEKASAGDTSRELENDESNKISRPTYPSPPVLDHHKEVDEGLLRDEKASAGDTSRELENDESNKISRPTYPAPPVLDHHKEVDEGLLRDEKCLNTNDLGNWSGSILLGELGRELSKVDDRRNRSLISHIQKILIDHRIEFIQQNSSKILEKYLEHKELLPDLWKSCLKISFSSENLIHMKAYLLEALLQRDGLNMGETEIWENLLKWCLAQQNVGNNPTEWSNEDIANIKNELSKFIRLIRFDKIAHKNVYNYRYILPQYIKDKVENEALLRNRIIGCYEFLRRSIMLLRNNEESDSEYLRSSIRLRYRVESDSE